MRSEEELASLIKEAARDVASMFMGESTDEKADEQICFLAEAVYTFAGFPAKERCQRRNELSRTVSPRRRRDQRELNEILDTLMERWRELYPEILLTLEEIEEAEQADAR